MKKTEFDVVISGAGPAGAIAANILGRSGLSVLLIDQESKVRDIPRAIALDEEAQRIIAGTGLLEDIRKDSPRIQKVRILSPIWGEVLNIDVSAQLDMHPRIITFFQPDLERTLHEGLRRYPNVEFLQGTKLVSFQDKGNSVIAEIDSGNGAKQKIVARFLIGADGAHSFVRKELGISLEGETYEQPWLIVDVANDPAPDRAVEYTMGPGRPFVTMPAPMGRRRWEFILLPGETSEQMTSDDCVSRLLAPWGDVAGMKIERKAIYTFHARSCPTFQKDNVFLVGDAAHLTPPFAGQGLCAGLRDIDNLCWKIEWVIKGRAGAKLLSTYSEERCGHAKSMIGLAQFMGNFLTLDKSLGSFIKGAAIRLADNLPVIRDYVHKLHIKPENRLKHGFFVNSPAKSGLIGLRVPQNVAGLDETIDGRFLLVSYGPTDIDLGAELKKLWKDCGGELMHIHPGEAHCSYWSDLLLDGKLVIAIRPDKFVAGVENRDNAGKLVLQLGQQLQSAA